MNKYYRKALESAFIDSLYNKLKNAEDITIKKNCVVDGYGSLRIPELTHEKILDMMFIGVRDYRITVGEDNMLFVEFLIGRKYEDLAVDEKAVLGWENTCHTFQEG